MMGGQERGGKQGKEFLTHNLNLGNIQKVNAMEPLYRKVVRGRSGQLLPFHSSLELRD